MSPGEAVREKILTLLADPVNGLNPAFIANCQKRSIPVPLPGTATIPVPLPGDPTTQPFNFGTGSPSVFRMMEDIAWLERNTSQQYPCLVCYVKSSEQSREGRPFGALFFGYVVVDLTFYVAWYEEQLPTDNNFEAVLDALEESLIVVLNAMNVDWRPVLYSNLLDFPGRLPLTPANDNQLLRRGIKAQVTALVSI